MFLAQLMAFLIAHHHAAWVAAYFTGHGHTFQWLLVWAQHHGFRYQP